MIKKIIKGILVSVFILVLVFVFNVEEDYVSINSQKFIKVYADKNDIIEFVNEIGSHYESAGVDLSIESISLFYDSKKDLTIHLTYSKYLEEENEMVAAFIEYSDSKKGIVKSEYLRGSPKAILVMGEALDVSKWKVSIDQGYRLLIKELKEKNEYLNDSIKINCYEDKWIYTIGNEEIEISVEK